jgi:hypothetical protein
MREWHQEPKGRSGTDDELEEEDELLLDDEEGAGAVMA